MARRRVRVQTEKGREKRDKKAAGVGGIFILGEGIELGVCALGV